MRPHAGPVAPADEQLAACLVGSWHQTDGRQRLDVRAEPLEIRLVSGGADRTLAADGTGTVAYPTPAVWSGSNAVHRLDATISGTGTLTYTVSAGGWTEVADHTRIVTSLTLDGTADPPRPGAACRATAGTYRCGPTDLVIETGATTDTYTRTA
jgi:hypothetical protein